MARLVYKRDARWVHLSVLLVTSTILPFLYVNAHSVSEASTDEGASAYATDDDDVSGYSFENRNALGYASEEEDDSSVYMSPTGSGYADEEGGGDLSSKVYYREDSIGLNEFNDGRKRDIIRPKPRPPKRGGKKRPKIPKKASPEWALRKIESLKIKFKRSSEKADKKYGKNSPIAKKARKRAFDFEKKAEKLKKSVPRFNGNGRGFSLFSKLIELLRFIERMLTLDDDPDVDPPYDITTVEPDIDPDYETTEAPIYEYEDDAQ